MATLFSCQAGDNDKAREEKPAVQEVQRRTLAGGDVPLRSAVDSIVVYKSRREMHVYGNKKRLKRYVISLGLQPLGKKRLEGDCRTPEGRYTISAKNPNSIYHKNLAISYPNADDLRYAKAGHLDPGGDVKIHGLPNKPRYPEEAYLRSDWTWGCIAVSNEEIDELYRHTKTGTPILILP